LIKLTCIQDYDDFFLKGEDYFLITRQGGGFVEVINKHNGYSDFVMSYTSGIYGYPILGHYFNLVPINKRMVLIEKLNNTYEFKL
jgi:hypothetical protein